MPSPSPPGPDLPLSCSSASSEEEEDREEEYDDEEEYEDEEAVPVGEARHDNAAAETLPRNPSPSYSSSSSGDAPPENGTLTGSGGGAKRPLSVDPAQEVESKRARSYSAAVTPATPLSVALSLPAQVQHGDSAEMDRKAIVSVGEDSRRLFQRLWTDEDEIGLLNGFYEYSRRGNANFHDMSPFYDQIKASLQFDFNKNQLVEKLRRLKKKYRNVVKKLSTGKDFAFKSAHDQLTFEISKKIWQDGLPPAGDDDEEPVVERKTLRGSRKSQAQASKRTPPPPSSMVDGGGNRVGGGAAASAGGGGGTGSADLRSNYGIPPVNSMVEETVRSCLSPIFKELMYCAANGPSHTGFGLGMNPLPLSFGVAGEFKGVGSEEKWRKQQIMELEVYMKRIELVQEQIKLTLQELKSMGT